MKFSVFLAIYCTFLSSLAWGHPVVFKGGTVITTTNQRMMNMVDAHYSMTARWAAGVHFARLEYNQEEYKLGLAQVNFLAWRGNYEDSQANVYLQAAGGAEKLGDAAGRLQMMVDWEDRDYYLVGIVGQHMIGDQNFEYYRTRMGFSPFRGTFEEWQGFFIVQFDYNRAMRKHVIATPMLRLFYKNILIEFGSSLGGMPWLQIMTHL